MIRNACRSTFVILLGVVLAGCVTTGEVEQPETSTKEAARTNVNLGVGYLRQGKEKRALEKLERALEQDSELPAAHYYIALLHEQLGNADKARTHYREALSIDSDDPQAQNMYGAFLCRHGDYEDAAEYFVKAAKNGLYETPHLAWGNAGVCLRRAGESARAEEYFRNALEEEDQYIDALWNLAQLKYEQEQYLKTRAFLQRVMSAVRSPTTDQDRMPPEVLLLAVKTERKLGDEAAADRYARRLMEDFPESRQARELKRTGRYGSGS